jgi:hypothetical protein
MATRKKKPTGTKTAALAPSNSQFPVSDDRSPGNRPVAAPAELADTNREIKPGHTYFTYIRDERKQPIATLAIIADEEHIGWCSVGVAVCAPGDKFDRKVGRNIAEGRAKKLLTDDSRLSREFSFYENENDLNSHLYKSGIPAILSSLALGGLSKANKQYRAREGFRPFPRRVATAALRQAVEQSF